jgi:hypothetical protein
MEKKAWRRKAPGLKKILNTEIKIYVTPDKTTKFREIFQKTKLAQQNMVSRGNSRLL